MLAIRPQKIPLTSDINILNIYENSIIGGICAIGGSKIVEANMPREKFFKKDKPLSFIASLDANSLYSSTLDMSHIIGGFSLLNEARLMILLFFYKTVNMLIVGTMTELSKKRTR